MRWFWIASVLVILFVVDRTYAGGQGAYELLSIVQNLATSINRWSDDLLRPPRR
jgi:hypothetical protein